MAGGWHEALLDEARERLPAPVWHYFRDGAREGVTAAEAAEAWACVRLWPRVLRDVTAVDTSVRLLGTPYPLPFGIAPTSLQRCADDDGELAMARAASSAGVPLVVSSNAGFRFAEIGAVAAPWWLQAYLPPDRADCLPLLEAAVAAGAGAVVLTVDTPFPGTKYAAAEAWDAIDLSWHRCNYPPGFGATRLGDWARDLGLDDIGWLATRLGVPVVVKGVLRPDDAARCVEAGAAAVWVSNHGGRQLDRTASTAEALPAVVAAVGARAEVYVDGGITSGLDIITALALGADAAFLGRVPLFALAAGGAARVQEVLRVLAGELLEAMELSGSVDVAATRGLSRALEPSPERANGPDLHERRL